MPNDTYEDHRLTCTADFVEGGLPPGPNNNDQINHRITSESHDSVDASDYLDMDGASALVINTDDNEDMDNADNVDDESKNRSNTSKNKLESLLGELSKFCAS